MKKISMLSKMIFKIIRCLVKLFYPKINIIGIENIPTHNTVIVANHAQMNGPICAELFMNDNCFIWCAGEMMNAKDVPEYAFNDFWSQKPKLTRPFYKILSYIIAPLADCLFNNARTIAVYRDARIIGTFRETVDKLKNGNNILIFPECRNTRNNIINELQNKFVDVARLYYKRTGCELTFVPMYIAPALKKIYVGQGIRYNSENDYDDERIRVTEYLSEAITEIGRALPIHTVVPYSNILKNNYLTNKDNTEVPK